MLDLARSTRFVARQNRRRTNATQCSAAFSRTKTDAVATGSRATASARQGWANEIWASFVSTIDGALRSYYNIIEFSDDPNCVLRVGRMEVERTVSLAGGIIIAAGETIGTIHLWNEHLPAFSPAGPDVRWAVDMRQRVTRSLVLLARFVDRDDDWRELRAFRGEAAFSSRTGDKQLQRVAKHYGFERKVAPSSMLRQLHDFGECFSAWGLTRVYNPAALARQRFFRRYQELWLSRAVLTARYGENAAETGGCPPSGVGEDLQWSC